MRIPISKFNSQLESSGFPMETWNPSGIQSFGIDVIPKSLETGIPTFTINTETQFQWEKI